MPLVLSFELKDIEKDFTVLLFIMHAVGGSNIRVCGWNHSVTSFKLKLKIKKYFPVGLFIMLYKVVRTLNLWMKSYGVTRHSNESFYKQYFPVVLFIMLYRVVLTFKPVAEILKCDHSNESYWAVLLIMLYKVVLLLSLWVTSYSADRLKWKLGLLCFS